MRMEQTDYDKICRLSNDLQNFSDIIANIEESETKGLEVSLKNGSNARLLLSDKALDKFKDILKDEIHDSRMEMYNELNKGSE